MEVVFDNTEHDSSLGSTLARYFEKEEYVDVTFICKGGRKVKAHKLLLISVSHFLKKMFSEWNGNQDMITITVPDVDHNILKYLLDFLYEGTMKLSRSELVEFKAVQKMLGIRFPGASVMESEVRQFPRNRPPPLLKLDNNSNSALQRNASPQNSNNVARKETGTAAIANDTCVQENNARQPANPVDGPLIPDRRSMDPDDDPLNVPDLYFVPTTIGPTSQTQGVTINGSGGIVPVEGEGHNRQTASSFSPAGQQETRPVTNHSAYSNSLIEQSGSRTQKRPIAAVSDTEHSVGIPSAVNLKQTEGKRTGNRSKGTSFMSVTDQNANSAVDTGGTHSRRAKTRKT